MRFADLGVQAAAAPAEGGQGEGETAAKGGRKRASARLPDERLAAVQEKNRCWL